MCSQYFIVLLFMLQPLHCSSNCATDEESEECQNEHAWRLNYDLFETNSYNPLIRPVLNVSDSLTISFSLALSTIINVDSKNQVIITNVWLQMTWHDYQLEWVPEEYGKINQTRTSVANIWVPDIVLFNNADGNYEPTFSPNVVISNTGNITFIPPAIYTSSCSIDVEYFPFDQQTCQMKFGSWTFQGKTLHYQFQSGIHMMDMTEYKPNGGWSIISCRGSIKEIKDTITGEPKELIVYDLIIRRKTLFYTVNLIIPCFLHAFVSLCVFMLPADGSEKMTLGISVLVSLVVFLNVVQKILPPSMKIPLIAKYFLFTFIMNVLEILVTVIIIFVNHKSPRPKIMPKWVCWLLLYKLPKLLLMERPDHDDRWQPKKCTAPPSYASTPQMQRAAIRTVTPNLKQRIKRDCTSVSPDDARSREKDRLNSLRRDFKLHHGSGSSTHSSMGSGSHMSAEDSSNGAEVAESLGTDHSKFPLPPFNGHRCMLHESPMAKSDNTEGHVRPKSSHPQTGTSEGEQEQESEQEGKPLWLTSEMYSGINAVKFIWRQMQNKDEYETVLDDWKYVAAVLDRLFMVIFVLVTLGGTLGVLVNAPHILETVDEEKIIEKIKNGAL